eukprot:148704-Chlamydomonas_euryale.AAC.1
MARAWTRSARGRQRATHVSAGTLMCNAHDGGVEVLQCAARGRRGQSDERKEGERGKGGKL